MTEVDRWLGLEVADVWAATDRKIGIAVAWSVFGVTLGYVVVMVWGFVAAGGLDSPLVDPFFAIMELLILVEAPLIVALFAVLHRYAGRAHKSLSLAAVAFAVMTASITMSVHVVVLTVGRQVQPSLVSGFDRFFSFTWPSVVYALDILAWDYCFPLALLLVAPMFVGGGLARAVRTGLIFAALLCLAGLVGMVTANMQIRNVGIVGYAGVFPVVAVLMARLFQHEADR